MSKPARITILCEDPQQACFVRRFLMNRGWTRHELRENVAPAGSGSGEQWVREQFPQQMKAYRSQCHHLRSGLVAVIDADLREVQYRVRGFETACAKQGVTPKQPDERVLYVIPKRNIETWLAYLRGEPAVDEQTQYPRYEYQSRCHPEVDRLDAMCKTGQLEGEPPASLQRCCQEFQAFWRLIR